MSTIAAGIFKKLAWKRQASLGVIAAAGAAGTARYQRRVTSTLDLTKAVYDSAEISTEQQDSDQRHGVRQTGGTLSGQLSVGGHQQVFESVLRQNVQNAVTAGALTVVTAAVTAGFAGTYTRVGGSWLTDGFKLGDVVTSVGWTAPATNNNGHYAIITALTALVMTVRFLDKKPIVAKASGDSVTISQVGKKTWVPITGHTRDYYTVEHWFSDILSSEVYRDTVFTGFTVNLGGTGMIGIEVPMMGLDQITDVLQYFTAPASAPDGPQLASANGVLLIDGAVAGIVTSQTIVVNGNYSMPADGVVGENVLPDIIPGRVQVSGQITVLFESAAMRDRFVNETESTLISAFTGDNSPTPPFTSFVMPRVKYNGSSKDDGEKGLTLTMPYKALRNINGSALAPSLNTTISIQDSDFE